MSEQSAEASPQARVSFCEKLQKWIQTVQCKSECCNQTVSINKARIKIAKSEQKTIKKEKKD